MQTARQYPDRLPITCLGEAILDLICERRLASGEIPSNYVPWSGGALANVAVSVARNGAPAALLGGVGSDNWGRRLRNELAAEGVSVDWLATVDGADTPIALVEFGLDSEPVFNVFGEAIGPTMEAAAMHLAEAVDGSQALVVGSNTMVGATERQVTRDAVDLALGSDLPVLFDPNFRPNRWLVVDQAREFCRELTSNSSVVKLNRGEAELITGESDPLTAARRMVDMGPDLVVVTDAEGAIVTAGATEAVHHPSRTELVSPLGAGDAFMGGLAAGLAELEWNLSEAGAVLPIAASAAADACRKWGAW